MELICEIVLAFFAFQVIAFVGGTLLMCAVGGLAWFKGSRSA